MNLINSLRHKKLFIFVLICIITFFILWDIFSVKMFISSPLNVRINSGMGLDEIASILDEAKIIKSPFIFKITALITANAHSLRPGKYSFQGSLSYIDVVNILVVGGDEEVTVKILEGSTIFDIDSMLAKQKIIKSGELISYNKSQPNNLEGYLFPDTYRFFENSGAELVVKKMKNVFDEKVASLLTGTEVEQYEALILASLLEKEVPEFEDRQIVAGILQKRIANKWFLQVDSTICYFKEPSPCYPLFAIDFKVNSKYNSYMYKGLPPTPIGNPGHQAIQAALSPKKSNFWYYISDQKSKKTIFARTLEEHNANRVRYLQ